MIIYISRFPISLFIVFLFPADIQLPESFHKAVTGHFAGIIFTQVFLMIFIIGIGITLAFGPPIYL